MGQRGPQPEPFERLRLRGSRVARRRKAEPCLPTPEPGVPSRPMWLDREGRAEWRRVCRALKDAGTLSPAYRGVLAALCQNWSVFVRASKQLNGLDGSQLAEKRALESVASNACKLYLRSAKELSLTPGLRTRGSAQVKPPEPEAVTPKARFFEPQTP